jgi:hypothetical protein
MWVLASHDMFVVHVPSKWPPPACANNSMGAQTATRDKDFLIIMDDLQ